VTFRQTFAGVACKGVSPTSAAIALLIAFASAFISERRHRSSRARRQLEAALDNLGRAITDLAVRGLARMRVAFERATHIMPNYLLWNLQIRDRVPIPRRQDSGKIVSTHSWNFWLDINFSNQ
jgi:hypothetical protein